MAAVEKKLLLSNFKKGSEGKRISAACHNAWDSIDDLPLAHAFHGEIWGVHMRLWLVETYIASHCIAVYRIAGGKYKFWNF